MEKKETVPGDIQFDVPLKEGLILERESRFTMRVQIRKEAVSCHCPTTGRIADIDVSGRPCLLSRSKDPKRKTPYTVEAFSLNKPGDKAKSWIGINQNAVNRYVEHYLANGGFSGIVGTGRTVYREQFLGESKLDFLVDNIYLEVKTPLQQLQIEIPPYVKLKKSAPFSSTDRFVRHITELAGSLQKNQRAILLTCFIYDNPGFTVIEKSTNYEQVQAAVARSQSLGVEIWQANFGINKNGVKLEKYFPLEI
ncbi:DNA/RNA nuclease SfsA [Breznakiella homolactica]|uniref:DNA/RNA nuclease SfsA n=1 Tax=Breznakiella homolactica TaxID=2798577 RepID=A0A7T7XPA8_9SPIR|nr:DNA/RNA nuclease SfsA [Breznakiella homolactica]QQO09983.1 DNA/RNA nuclease SfsA [Breznakiella homolactica]